MKYPFIKRLTSKVNFYTLAVLLHLACFSLHSQELVLPGDYPDPSVVKIGDSYWASATTSNWMPAYPILKSKDLKNWTTESHVFYKKPDWVDFYFWAPEISYENGKVYIYYAAHKQGGNLCLGIASADKPEGPYKDHGPLMCQEVGSIDAFPMRDENGKLYIIWKEDGNSVGKPTPIWAQEINEDRTAFVGDKKEIFRNELPWESNLVEGVSMMKHGDYLYAFYAAAGCCGSECTYKSGVARAKTLLGPWEKYEKNPLLSDTENWKCPGHGTPVEKDGKFYFLYHAYNKKTGVFAGRQGVLKEFRFTEDGWVEFLEDNKATTDAVVASKKQDEFETNTLSSNWQWSVFHDVTYNLNKGKMELAALNTPSGAFLGHKVYSKDYIAQIVLNNKLTTAKAGIGLIGDEKNLIAVYCDKKTIKLMKIEDGKETIMAEKPYKLGEELILQLNVIDNDDLTFSFGSKGHALKVINEKPIDGGYLPPWDRAVRVGMISKGNNTEKAVFEKFVLNPLTK